MAFFKFRTGGDDHSNPSPQPESVEAMRKRAMHRLMGAVVLVVAGVIGFPMLFDSQPRPMAVDIPIEIPDKAKTRPITLPASPASAVAAGSQATPALAPLPATATAVPAKEPVAAPKTEDKVASAPVRKASEPVKAIAPVPAKPSTESSDAAKAQALLDGKTPQIAAAAVEGRFVVQVGAFSDLVRAKEARTKLERAGLKTYTQVVETKDGARTRVRVGPFDDKSEADKAAAKIKALDLPASILVL